MKLSFPSLKTALALIAKVFLTIILLVTLLAAFVGAYVIGVMSGRTLGKAEMENQCTEMINEVIKQTYQEPVTPTPAPTTPTTRPQTTLKTASWGGPDLWEAVNKRRSELGVNPLSSREDLCTIASIRLNELLELGKLDGHVGFSNMVERRPDLKWIFDRYGTVAEFLAYGGQTAEETVSLWENTLGHKKLLSGGEYVWGCIYVQNTFAVAITAF